jgi:hypothetical protein
VGIRHAEPDRLASYCDRIHPSAERRQCGRRAVFEIPGWETNHRYRQNQTLQRPSGNRDFLTSADCQRIKRLSDARKSFPLSTVNKLAVITAFFGGRSPVESHGIRPGSFGRGTQGEGFWRVSSGTGEPFVFVAACFSRSNMSLSVESTRVESLVKIL